MANILTPQQRVLATAAREIGYNRHRDPKTGTKYARETMPVFWPGQTWLTANGVSYCDIWITWVFWKALGEDFVRNGGLPAGASYNTDYRASKGGRISKSQARPGDVLVFDWNWNTVATNHVGILEKRLSSGNFQTIEGNTSAGSTGSQSNGGRVARRTRKPGQVRYVIRPVWSKAGGTVSSGGTGNATGTMGAWSTSPRVSKMTSAQIKKIQQTLLGFDLDLGKWGADGKYGDTTGKAVQELQTQLGLEADGVYGPGTEKAVATLKEDVDYIRRVTVRNQEKINDLASAVDWVRRVGEANQKRIDKAIAQTSKITRDGKEISMRQEIADAKTFSMANASQIKSISKLLEEARVDATEPKVASKASGEK